jgi:uncharacterized protein DUF3592
MNWNEINENKFAGTILVFILFCISLCGMWMLGPKLYENLEAYTWEEVPCIIISSRLVEPKQGGRLKISYKYRYKHIEYTSRRISNSKLPNRLVERSVILGRFPEGAKKKCYVKPGEPDISVIYRSVNWIMFIVFFVPLIFFALGCYLLYTIYFGVKNQISLRLRKKVIISPSLQTKQS